MPYDLGLERQIDSAAGQRWPNLEKKHMFGGICYLAGGNMAFGIWKDSLIVRTDSKKAEEKLKLEYTKPFDITGRPMKGWLLVAKVGYQNDLEEWLELGMNFATSLPMKGKK